MELTQNSFKKTEIGSVPEDWKLYRVDDLLDLLTDYDANGSFNSVAENVNVYDHEQYAWYVRSTDLENESDIGAVRYVDEKSYRFLKKTPLYGGELLFLKRGDIGKVYLFQSKTKYATLAPNLYLLKLNAKSFPAYLYYFFTSSLGQSQLRSKNASSTLGALYKDDVKSVIVPLPPTLTEQKAIATALSDVDALITSLDKLIEKKKAIKQGVMKNLFEANSNEGKNESEGRYMTYSLGELERLGKIEMGRGKVISKRDIEMNKGQYPIYSSSVKNDGLFGTFGEFMFDEELITWSVDGGGHFFYRPKHKFSVTNVSGYLRVKSEELMSKYLFLSLSYQHAKKTFNYQDKAHPSIISEEYQFPLLDLKIQKRVSEIVFGITSEINLLQRKRKKVIMIKQGMMQELLTGKTRLV